MSESSTPARRPADVRRPAGGSARRGARGGASSAGGFDRLRPRVPDEAAETIAGRTSVDAEGKRALFSTTTPVPAFGSLSLECSSCGQTSVIGLRRALRLAVPSVHLPVLRRRYPSWMRCPACNRWTWLRVRLRL